jgi:hypothetical protein
MDAIEQRTNEMRAQQRELTQSVGGRLMPRETGGFIAWFRRLFARRTP